MTEFTVRHKRFNPTDPRLGRHVRHDSRSLAYAYPEVDDPTTLKSIRHERYIPTLNQGNLGSCTGNAATGALGSGVFWDAGKTVLSATDEETDEQYAVSVYSDATKIDSADGSYPPTDTGSDGISVAKILQSRGLISGYQHAFSLNATLNALAKQPVIIGVAWFSDMFNPDEDGRIHPTGTVEGGHEVVLDELDVENQRVWIHNSWGDEWGVEGRCYLTWDDLDYLLQNQGDCTIFTPVHEPAPTPAPGPVSPVPVDPDDNKSVFEEILQELEDLLEKVKSVLS